MYLLVIAFCLTLDAAVGLQTDLQKGVPPAAALAVHSDQCMVLPEPLPGKQKEVVATVGPQSIISIETKGGTVYSWIATKDLRFAPGEKDA